jgi:O-antigen/teichoic acid export membrane protein
MNFLSRLRSQKIEAYIKKPILAFGSSSAAAQLLSMVYMLILARYLGPDSYGIYIAPFTICNLTSIMFNLGLDTWLLRSDTGKIPILNTTSRVLKLKIILGAIWGFLLLIFAPTLRPDLYPLLLLSIIIFDVWADSLLHTLLAALNVARKIRHYSFMLLFARGIRVPMLLALILLNVKDVTLIAGVRTILTFLSMIIALRLVKPAKRVLAPQEGFEILKAAQPFAFSEILSIIYMQVDTTLLSLIKNQTAAGIYSPVSNLINALFIIPSSVHLYSLPILARAYKNNNLQNYITLTSKLLLGLFILGIIMTAGIGLLGGRLVVILLGDAYALAGTVIVILSPLLFMKSMEFGFVTNIIAMGKQGSRLIPQAISAILNIVLNIWAIPRFGETGAATAYVISELFLFAGYGSVFYFWFKKFRAGKI